VRIQLRQIFGLFGVERLRITAAWSVSQEFDESRAVETSLRDLKNPSRRGLKTLSQYHGKSESNTDFTAANLVQD
jgi:hypothetical protein